MGKSNIRLYYNYYRTIISNSDLQLLANKSGFFRVLTDKHRLVEIVPVVFDMNEYCDNISFDDENHFAIFMETILDSSNILDYKTLVIFRALCEYFKIDGYSPKIDSEFMSDYVQQGDVPTIFDTDLCISETDRKYYFYYICIHKDMCEWDSNGDINLNIETLFPGFTRRLREILKTVDQYIDTDYMSFLTGSSLLYCLVGTEYDDIDIILDNNESELCRISDLHYNPDLDILSDGLH